LIRLALNTKCNELIENRGFRGSSEGIWGDELADFIDELKLCPDTSGKPLEMIKEF
jgi:hypothetical protein